MKGMELLYVVANATGLPPALVVKELQLLANRAGLSIEELTLDDLRELIAEHLQDIFMLAKETYPYSVS